MFLFEGEFGNVLHTGDCRLTSNYLHNLPLKYIAMKGRQTKSCLDYLFLDCTFGSCSIRIPSKHSAIQQVINCIWKHPNAPVVYLVCDLLGQEEILVEVSRTFGSKIYVDKTKNAECFRKLTLTAPHILSEDSSCRFQVFEGSPGLYERAKAKLTEAQVNLQPEPLFIRPSAQWYACEERSDNERKTNLRLSEAERDQSGVWHVCYSMHSSREELEQALQLLQPKWVISTTPPCRAMELDYVRNNCFSYKVTTDDPLWKLLNISTEKSILPQASFVSEALVNGVATSAEAAPKLQAADCTLSPPKKSTDSVKLCLNLSPTSGRRPITLFGRARLSLQDSNPLHEQRMKMRIGFSSLQKESVAEGLKQEKSKDILGRKRDYPNDCNMLHEENRAVSIRTDVSCDVTHKITELSSDDRDAEGLKHENSKDSLERKSIDLKYSNTLHEENKLVSVRIDVPCDVTHKLSEESSESSDAEGLKNEKSKDMLGRKRVTLKDCNMLHEENRKLSVGTDVSGKMAEQSSDDRDTEGWFTNSEEHREIGVGKSVSSSGSMNCFNSSIRKLYRSMNVSVPRPLPSLMELMNAGKQAKISSSQGRELLL